MATSEKTRQYYRKHEGLKFKRLGKTGFITSICGFGSYRVDYRVKQHAEALEYALKSGVNLMDTSSNYSDGGSEILIGNIVHDLMEKNIVERDELIIVSKGGYIQGTNLTTAMTNEQNGRPYQQVVKCAPDLWHSISPDFLADQITNSLDRLQLNYLDVYLLHNPEYFLTYSNVSDIRDIRKEYYQRVKTAFEYLETEVSKGRIRFYGISSNTFGEDASKRNFTSLEYIVSIANEIDKNNHFAVVQLPLNLMEKGGANIKNQQNGTKTFLEVARENNLGVLINRPLNAVRGNKVLRLADFEIKENRTLDKTLDLLDSLQKMENKIVSEYVNSIEAVNKEKNAIGESIQLSAVLKANIKKFDNVSQFNEVKKEYFIPRTNFAVNEIYKHYSSDQTLINRLNHYVTSVNIMLDSVESHLAMESNKKTRMAHDIIEPFLNEQQRALSLSQKSVMMINSLPGVSCTLLGMRSKKYVDDMLGAVKSNYIQMAKEFWTGK
ncbi:MAG: aldo/keto reductase [Ignavibacteria bacterium]